MILRDAPRRVTRRGDISIVGQTAVFVKNYDIFYSKGNINGADTA